jgi:hypothetical protein
MGRFEGHPVARSPKQLRLHRTLEELGWTGVIDELDDAARLKDQSVPDPILITTDGMILTGIGRWRSALFDDQHEIHCIEYPLNEEQATPFMLTYHRPRRGWNDFIRICVALKLEPYFQQKAVLNQQAGGPREGFVKVDRSSKKSIPEGRLHESHTFRLAMSVK